jgi:hypothetical protein
MDQKDGSKQQTPRKPLNIMRYHYKSRSPSTWRLGLWAALHTHLPKQYNKARAQISLQY